jgi:hypothetical protein
VLQGIVDGVVRAEFGIEVTQNSYTQGLGHCESILIGNWVRGD